MENHDVLLRRSFQNPLLQAAGVLAAVLVVNVAGAFLRSAGMTMDAGFPWLVAASFLLFFAAANTVLSLFANNTEQYWTRSMIGFVGVATLAAGMAYMFSSMTMKEAGSYKWIYIVLAITYVVFMLILQAIRKIVDFAQREEWNQPRLRKRRR
jgi:hypothetical protein